LQGFLDKAIEQYTIAIKLDPKDANAHYNLAIVYNSKGLNDKANEHFRIARQLNFTLFKGRKTQ
jgi:Tfp pilus assembly protein PilF